MSVALGIRFLVVDDEESVRRLCMTVAKGMGFSPMEAHNGEQALALLETQPAVMILTDLVMPGMSGLELLVQAKKILARVEVAVMTGHGSIETAMHAMKLGAYDYITKPFSPLEARLFLHRMADKIQLTEENQFLRERMDAETRLHGIVGITPRIEDTLRMISRLKDTRTPVLIVGESGTGKELVARAIHFRGSYAAGPFVAVDCGSLVPSRIESELFGYEKGAFTGALWSKSGLIQSANGGTIFLDEVGELPLESQLKLLRVLKEKEVHPVGSNEPLKVDVRVIAATNRNLEQECRAGHFCKDLYLGLEVATIHVPALREHRSDIPMMVHWFLDRRGQGSSVQVTSEALKCLLEYHWPGNVRELENAIERATALGDGKIIDVRDLPPGVLSMHSRFELPSVVSPALISSTDLEDIERATIQRVFEQVKGDKVMARKMLGISRATLYRKLKRYNIGARPLFRSISPRLH